jgi:hypothetical protein
MSELHACRLMELRRSTHRYRARKAKRDAALRTRLKELAATLSMIAMPENERKS